MMLTEPYYKQKIFDDLNHGVRVVVDETGSLFALEEGFSLRIDTRYIETTSEEERPIRKIYSIEQHRDPPHNFPHMQFKFSAERIKFRLRIDVRNREEYNRLLKGFIYRTKFIIEHLETTCPQISDTMMNRELVETLEEDGKFLITKVMEGLEKYGIDADPRRWSDDMTPLTSNRIMSDFMGEAFRRMIEYINKKE